MKTRIRAIVPLITGIALLLTGLVAAFASPSITRSVVSSPEVATLALFSACLAAFSIFGLKVTDLILDGIDAASGQ